MSEVERLVVRACLLLCCLAYTHVFARSVTFGTDLQAVPLVTWIAVAGMSLCPGLVNTLSKLGNPDVPVPSLPLEIVKDGASALLAGFVVFAICEAREVALWYEVVFIIGAAFAGAKFLAAVSGVVIDQTVAVMRRVFPGGRGD